MDCTGKSWRIAERVQRSGLPVVAAVVGIIAAAVWGCSRQEARPTETVVVFGLDDRVSGATRGVHFNQAEARKMLERAFERSKSLELVQEKTPESYRAELTIALASERESQHAEEDGVYRAVQVDLDLHRWLDEHERETLTARGKAFRVQDPDDQGRQEGFEQVLQEAIDNAVELVDLQLASHSMTTDELARLLESDRTEDRLYLLRTLRQRQEPDLVPQIIEMLRDPDPDVAIEAVGVLVAYREPRAVVPLIRMTRGRDQVFLLQIITALTEIGGPVARGYLFTLAAGHPVPAIRERASEGLEQLRRREPSLPESTPTEAVALPRAEPDASGPAR